jgi:hypothetical protein
MLATFASMYSNSAEIPLMWGRKLKLKAKLETVFYSF